MRDRNSCNPQLGQRRLAIGGNGDGSGRFGCGMDALHTFTGESATGLSVTDAHTKPLSMMLALDARSSSESIREGLKRLGDSQSRKVSNRPVPDLGTISMSALGHKQTGADMCAAMSNIC
jgi:hypothetical protein